MKNMICKAIALVIIIFVSLSLSTTAINNYLWEVEDREKTLADLIFQQQMQEQLAQAEEKVQEEVTANDLVIEQDPVVLNTPTPTPTPAPTPTSTPEVEEVEEVLEEEVLEEEVLEEEVLEEDTLQEEAIPEPEPSEIPQVPELSEDISITNADSLTLFMAYLEEYYFLNGHIYAAAETDPDLKVRKELARDMEDYMSLATEETMVIMDFIQTYTYNLTDVTTAIENVTALQEEFRALYSDVGDYGAEFAAIYEAIDAYFDQCLEVLNLTLTILTDLSTSSNIFLAYTLLTTALENDLTPMIVTLINDAVAVKELTNPIFLEGVEGVPVLTQEEVLELFYELL